MPLLWSSAVLDTLVHGVLPPPVPPPALERPALRDRVRELLQPAEVRAAAVCSTLAPLPPPICSHCSPAWSPCSPRDSTTSSRARQAAASRPCSARPCERWAAAWREALAAGGRRAVGAEGCAPPLGAALVPPACLPVPRQPVLMRTPACAACIGTWKYRPPSKWISAGTWAPPSTSGGQAGYRSSLAPGWHGARPARLRERSFHSGIPSVCVCTCSFQEHVNRLNIVFKPVLGTQFEDPRRWAGDGQAGWEWAGGWPKLSIGHLPSHACGSAQRKPKPGLSRHPMLPLAPAASTPWPRCASRQRRCTMLRWTTGGARVRGEDAWGGPIYCAGSSCTSAEQRAGGALAHLALLSTAPLHCLSCPCLRTAAPLSAHLPCCRPPLCARHRQRRPAVAQRGEREGAGGYAGVRARLGEPPEFRICLAAARAA